MNQKNFMLADRPWPGVAVARLGLGIFTTFFLGAILQTVVQQLSERYPLGDKQLVMMILGALCFQAASLLWIGFFVRSQNLDWDACFGFRSNVGKAIFFGVLAGLLAVPVAAQLQNISGFFLERLAGRFPGLHLQPGPQVVIQKLLDGVSQAHQWYFLLVAVFLAPLAEELLFRGILYPTLKRYIYPPLAVLLTSVLFAITHQNLMALVPLTFLAFVMCIIYERTQNLLAPIITHAVFNGVNFLMLLNYKSLSRFVSEWSR